MNIIVKKVTSFTDKEEKWFAMSENDKSGIIGVGSTKEEAIADLKNKLRNK